MIVDIRGKGLLIGLESTPSALPRGNFETLLKHGVLSKDTHGTGRALTAAHRDREQLDWGWSASRRAGRVRPDERRQVHSALRRETRPGDLPARERRPENAVRANSKQGRRTP